MLQGGYSRHLPGLPPVLVAPATWRPGQGRDRAKRHGVPGRPIRLWPVQLGFVWLIGLRDFVLSAWLIEREGIDVETNPFVASVLRLSGTNSLFGFKFAGLMVFTLIALFVARRNARLGRRLVVFCFACYLALTFWWDAVLWLRTGETSSWRVIIEEERGPGAQHRLLRHIDKDRDGRYEMIVVQTDRDGDGKYEDEIWTMPP